MRGVIWREDALRVLPEHDDFSQTARALFPQRLQNLHQLAMDEFIAADHVAGLERVVIALDAGDGAAGLAHDDLAGREIPGLQVAFPIAVEAAGRDVGEVERGGAEAAQPCDLVLHFHHFQARQLMVAAADMRQSAGDHAFVELAAAGDAASLVAAGTRWSLRKAPLPRSAMKRSSLAGL